MCIRDRSRVYHTVQCQPNPSPIHQSFTNLPVHVQPTRSINRASAIIHPTVSTGDNQIIPIGTGRHPICQSNVNQVPIVRQSEDNCPSNLGTSILWGPTEVSRRRTIQTINLRSDATPAPVHTTDPLHSANSKAIWQSSTNPFPIQDQSVNRMPILCQSMKKFAQQNMNFANSLPIL